MIIGCGNSGKFPFKREITNILELSEKMAEDGFTHIHSVDISDVVIEQMNKRAEEKKLSIKCNFCVFIIFFIIFTFIKNLKYKFVSLSCIQ